VKKKIDMHTISGSHSDADSRFGTLACNTRVTPNLMPPNLLCWPTTSEADVGDMTVQVESSRQYSVKFCCLDNRGAV
jgi:hypothetical protein